MQNKQKIKILRCKDGMLWYNTRIGEVFDVQFIQQEGSYGVVYLWVRTGDAYNTLNWVDEKDVEYVS